MIAEARENIVRLWGKLDTNQWLTIRAAAELLLDEHPGGIIIDCQQLTDVNAQGAMTFADAIHHIQSRNARMIVARLPEFLWQKIKAMPDIGGNLPLAKTLEQAMASLDLMDPIEAGSKGGVMAPIFDGVNVEEAIRTAEKYAKDKIVHTVYIMQVPEGTPLATPLPEREQMADNALQEAKRICARCGLKVTATVERTYNIAEGVKGAAQDLSADYIVLAGDPDHRCYKDVVEVIRGYKDAQVLIQFVHTRGRKLGGAFADKRRPK